MLVKGAIGVESKLWYVCDYTDLFQKMGMVLGIELFVTMEI